jgi:hypoxanthine phosphoribosyltransferase
MKKNIEINGHKYRQILSQEIINTRTKKIAYRIKKKYKNSNSLVLLFIANGGVYFGTDLSKALSDIGVPHSSGVVHITRCIGDQKFCDGIEMNGKPSVNLLGKDVIVVEDLIDEGKSMNFLDHYLKTTEGMVPNSIQYCTLVEKKKHIELSFKKIKYCILRNVGPQWLVGYGMDSNFGYRGLRGIYAKID